MPAPPFAVEQQLDDDLRSFVTNGHVGVLHVDARRALVLRANTAACAFLGADSGTLTNSPLQDLPIVDGRGAFDRFLATVARGEASQFTGTLGVQPTPNDTKWLDVSARMTGSSTEPRVVALLVDVTARVASTAELIALRARATNELDDARRERDALQQTVNESTRARNDFVAMLSHELRNPLAPIRNAARIARTPTTTPDQLEWSLAVIERQVLHVARFVDDLLDASRLNRGVLQIRSERTRLNDALAAGIEVARPLIESRKHRLELKIPPSPLWVNGDPVRLAQIFGNLITNAAKFSAPGGEIVVEASSLNDRHLIRVSDKGEGITAELLPRIFDMFTQAPAEGRREGGLGIGLALVHGLVKLHGGTVEARSQGVGCGSEFTVTLPISVDTQATTGDFSGTMADVPRQLRILVADDNVDAADSLAVLLRLQGHEVRVAHDGMSAVKEAGTFRPEVALLDIGMPIMSGNDVARWIRSQPWGGAVRVVALTGWNQPMDRVQTSLSGFDRHLAKPVAMPDLLECFADVKSNAASADS